MAMQGTSDAGDQDTVAAQLRRGDTAMGTDGQLGTVEQIVVDPDTGEQRGIVIRRGGDGVEFEVSVDQVARLAQGELHLKLARADLDSRPDLARPYDPDQYVAVYPGDTPPQGDATRIAHDTGHPVVTDVRENAAKLVVPQKVAATDTTTDILVDAPTTPRMPVRPTADGIAAPMMGGNEPTRALSRNADGADGAAGAIPRHAGPGETHEQMASELTQGPAAEPSPIESTTGDLIGGRPTTGGTGAASTPTSASPDASGRRTSGNGDIASPAAGSVAPVGVELTDDELSNPDAALATNPTPDTARAVTTPFQPGVGVGAEGPVGGSFPADQPGMADVFSKATNTAADDTWVEREPDALNETDSLPAGESGPRYDAADVPLTGGASIAGSATWRPNEVRAESGGATDTSPTLPSIAARAAPGASDQDQVLASEPQPAPRPTLPAEGAGAVGRPAWAVPLAASVGGAALLGGVAAGVVVALRRRGSRPKRTAQKAASAAADGIGAMAAATVATAQELTDAMLKPTGDRAAEAAKQVRKTAKRTARRTARRAGWFRRGFLLGSALAVLFAPASGDELRTQLASRIEQWRSRMAS